MKTLLGEVKHTVKVTRLKGRGWGIRLYVDGVLNQEDLALSQQQIGHLARDMLRMEDKCGNISKYADAARHRVGLKQLRNSI